MTKAQKQKAIDLIKADCQLRERYVDHLGDSDDTCAVGCLALAAGVKRKRFDGMNNTAFISMLGDVADAIRSKFGLSVNQQVVIQELNDGVMELEERRYRIVDYLQSLTTED